MSLRNPHRFLGHAWRSGQAICGFNVDSFDMAKGVIEGIEDAGVPSFLQLTPATLELWGWEGFAAGVMALIRETRVDIALHLDHATDVADIERAIAIGFSSVMFDGSTLDFAQNVRATRDIIARAQPHQVFVEGEIGHVGRDGEIVAESLTSVSEAVEFSRMTGIGALAVAVGTRHGHIRGAGDLQFDRIVAIREQVEVPLVLHGASRVPLPALQHAVTAGITKINMGTELRNIWWGALDRARGEKPRVALNRARTALRGYVANTLSQMSKPVVDDAQSFTNH